MNVIHGRKGVKARETNRCFVFASALSRVPAREGVLKSIVREVNAREVNARDFPPVSCRLDNRHICFFFYGIPEYTCQKTLCQVKKRIFLRIFFQKSSGTLIAAIYRLRLIGCDLSVETYRLRLILSMF